MSAGCDEQYLVIAGERRYRAAIKADLAEIPAIVRAGDADSDPDEQAEKAELSVEALIENELRVDLDAAQRARAYQRLLALGLKVRGLAERLGGKDRRAALEQRIRTHLPILKLPEDLQARVGSGEIPLLAVRPLLEIAKVHEQLARDTAGAVLEPSNEYEPYTWGQLAEQPLLVAANAVERLPDGVFQSRRAYPLASFTLTPKAAKNLAAYEQLRGAPLERVTFAHELVEAVRPLGVVFDIGDWDAFVVGQDVGDRIAEDFIAATLKQARASARRQRDGSANMTVKARAGPTSAAASSAARPPSSRPRLATSAQRASPPREGQTRDRTRRARRRTLLQRSARRAGL